MTLSIRPLLSCLLLLAPLTLTAQEPAGNPIQELLDPDVIAARVRLVGEIDKSLAMDSYLSLASKFLANNPLGIDVTSPDAPLRAQLDLGENEGVIVTNVPDESVGAKAGLKVHDVIVGMNANTVNDIGQLAEWLGAADGKTVTLKVRRAGKTIELTAEPQKPVFAKVRWAQALDRDLANAILVHADSYRIGVTLSEADDTLRTQLRLAAGEGLVVTEVVSDSAAEQAGVRTHDVLTMLDGKRLTTVEAINAQIQEIKDRSAELLLLRSGKEVTLHVAPRKTTEAAFSEAAVRVWDTTSCKNCHQDAHALDPHRLMGQKLGVDRSVWTDGSHTRFHFYDKAYKAQLDFANGALQDQQDPAEAGSTQKQIDALKSQLSTMQQTLAALESSLRQPESPARTTPAPEQPQKD